MRSKRKKNNIVFALILLIMVLGLGYAFLRTDLTINGTSKISATSWNIFFDNVQVSQGSVALSDGDSVPTINPTSLTDVSYTITLKKPGDYYEFTIDVVNDGTIDAMIGTIASKLNGVEISDTNPLPTYLSYTVTYSDNIPLAANHLLAKNSTDTYKIRLAFRTDINPSDLPTGGATNTLSFNVNYIQKDSNGYAPHPVSFSTDSWQTIIFLTKLGFVDAYHVGDTREVELGNDLGTHTLRVANATNPSECILEGFSQTACGFVLEFTDLIVNYKRMSSSAEGGWPTSEMRTYLNDTTDSTSIINSLPEVLRNAIIDTKVVSGYYPSDATANYISTDKLYLLDPHEVLDDVSNSSYGIKFIDKAYSETRQLDYYKNMNTTTSNSNSAIKKYGNGSYGQWWWLRSKPSNSSGYYLIGSSGMWASSSADSAGSGISPAFRLSELNKTPLEDLLLQPGDYFTMVPDVSTYTVSSSDTGYSSDQVITPNELTLWRVIKANNDGTYEAVSEYASSYLYLSGTVGFQKLISTFQLVASKYAKSGYTVATRIFGYDGQTPILSDTSLFDGTKSPSTNPDLYSSLPSSTPTPTSGTGQEYNGGIYGDNLYLKDIQLVGDVYKSDTATYGTSGLKAFVFNSSTSYAPYWIAHRKFFNYGNSEYSFGGSRISDNNISSFGFRNYYSSRWSDNYLGSYLRPIITLRSGLKKVIGEGTKNNPYTITNIEN